MLRDAFIKLDADGDGFISRQELHDQLQKYSPPARFPSMWPYQERIFEVADWDADNRLSLLEFLSSFADGPGVVPHDIIATCTEGVKIRFTDEELEALRERFHEIDKNQDNFIDKDELLAAMREVLSVKYPKMSDAELEDIVASVIATADADRDGKLNLSEFIRSYQEDQGVLPTAFTGRAESVKRRLTKDEVERLKVAFTELDENEDGFIDYGELCKAVTDALQDSGLSEADTRDLVDTIMLTADRNRDGKLSLTEFIRNFVQNEDIMAVPVEAAIERREQAKARIETLVDSGDLYKMVKLFTYLDTNQDGFLDREELFGILFRTLAEWYPTWDDAQRYKVIDLIIEGADTDGDGRISIDEFVHSYVKGYGILPVELVREIAGQLRRVLSTEELQQVHDTFVALDGNGDGFVSNDELRHALTQALGPCVSAEELENITAFILSRVDTDRDGRISLKEFITACELDVEVPVDVPAEAAPQQPAEEQAAAPEQAEQQPVTAAPPAAEPAPLGAAPLGGAPQTATEVTAAPAEAPPAATQAPPAEAAAPAPLGVVEAPQVTPQRAAVNANDDIEQFSPVKNDVSRAAITDQQLRIEFARFDKDKSGSLSKQEFKKKFLALEWCGLVPTDGEFEKMWSKYCGGDNQLSYDEFCLFMLHRSQM